MKISTASGVKSIFIFLLLFIIQHSLYAQGRHFHLKNEIGISPGIVYSPSHGSWGAGLHVHYFRTLADHSRWALGGGVEKTFLHGGHWTISAGPRFQVLDQLSVAVMPGISFLNHDDHEIKENGDSHETKFSLHFEVVYDLFHLNHFHLGPAFDYSWSKGDSHFMLGVHFAYLF